MKSLLSSYSFLPLIVLGSKHKQSIFKEGRKIRKTRVYWRGKGRKGDLGLVSGSMSEIRQCQHFLVPKQIKPLLVNS